LAGKPNFIAASTLTATFFYYFQVVKTDFLVRLHSFASKNPLAAPLFGTPVISQVLHKIE
jgi:hypothetical protein